MKAAVLASSKPPVGALVLALFASAAKAPRFRLNYIPGPEPSEAQFLEELRRLEGMPANFLEKPDLLRLVLPALKADARLYRNYTYRPGEPLELPIYAYGGQSDPNVRPEHLERWGEETTGGFVLRSFPGGHFFIDSAREPFLTALKADLASIIPP